MHTNQELQSTPNQPNGPKWPAKDAYLKDVTYTVHYTSKNRNAKLPADSVQKGTMETFIDPLIL